MYGGLLTLRPAGLTGGWLNVQIDAGVTRPPGRGVVVASTWDDASSSQQLSRISGTVSCLVHRQSRVLDTSVYRVRGVCGATVMTSRTRWLHAASGETGGA